MIDTHAHLHLAEFERDRAQVLARAFALGIGAIVEIAIDPADWAGSFAFVESDPRLRLALGIHPHLATPAAPETLRRAVSGLPHPSVVALGETGVDLYRHYAPPETQEALFVAHLQCARETGLPVVVHCRDAFPEVFGVLDREAEGPWRGVFHCFSGGIDEARAVLARGFHLGLGGTVTFDPERWRAVVREMPLDRILLETDCPYLRPAPDRRGRNEPAFIFRSAEVIAGLRGIEAGELERAADANARALFGLPEP